MSMLIQITRYPDGFTQCSSCGQCCTRIDKATEEIKQLFKDNNIAKSLYKFPYKWDDTGRCENLTEDNKCAVYDTRPNICRIDYLKKVLKVNGNSFYDNVIDGCNKLMDENNIDENYRIKKN